MAVFQPFQIFFIQHVKLPFQSLKSIPENLVKPKKSLAKQKVTFVSRKDLSRFGNYRQKVSGAERKRRKNDSATIF
jgi:hypothetical protein